MQLSCLLIRDNYIRIRMRETPLKTAVLEILKTEQKPVSIPALILLLAKKDLKPNKTTLYRLFQKLVSLGKVEEVLLDSGIAFYELKLHHHHHFTCRNCNDIQCISDPELERTVHHLESQFQAKGFQIETHQFSLSGICQNCLS